MEHSAKREREEEAEVDVDGDFLAYLSGQNFMRERGASTYFRMFELSPDLLLSWSQHDHILDLGGGDGTFCGQIAGIFHLTDQLAGCQREAPNVTLITADKSSVTQERPNYQYFDQGLFEDLRAEAVTQRFGPVSAVFDLWGVFSYTRTPSEALRLLHSIMADGAIWRLYAGRTEVPESQLSTHVVTLPDGQDISFIDWLTTRVPGFRVVSRAFPSPCGRFHLTLQKIPLAKGDQIPQLQFIAYHETNELPKPRIFRELAAD